MLQGCSVQESSKVMFSRQVAVGCHDAQAAEGIFRCLLT